MHQGGSHISSLYLSALVAIGVQQTHGLVMGFGRTLLKAVAVDIGCLYSLGESLQWVCNAPKEACILHRTKCNSTTCR